MVVALYVPRTDEIAFRSSVHDSVVGKVLAVFVTVEFLIGPLFQPLVLQFISEQQALPQDVRQRLLAFNGEINDVV